MLTVGASGCSTDPKSYRYGQRQAVGMAGGMWKASRANPRLFPEIDNKRDACEVTVETDASDGMPALEGLDLDYVIDVMYRRTGG